MHFPFSHPDPFLASGAQFFSEHSYQRMPSFGGAHAHPMLDGPSPFSSHQRKLIPEETSPGPVIDTKSRSIGEKTIGPPIVSSDGGIKNLPSYRHDPSIWWDVPIDWTAIQISEGIELLLKSLTSDALVQKLFPQAIVDFWIIQWGNIVVLRKPFVTTVACGYQAAESCLPPGTCLVIEKNVAMLCPEPDLLPHPILAAFAKANELPSLGPIESARNAAELVIARVKEYDPDMYSNRHEPRGGFHLTPPPARIEAFRNQINVRRWIPMDAVLHPEKVWEVFQFSSPPVRLQEKPFQVVVDSNPLWRSMSLENQRHYVFHGENGDVSHYVFEQTGPGGLSVPATMLQDDYTGLRIVNHQTLKPKSPPYNAHHIKFNPGSPVIISPTLRYATMLDKAIGVATIRPFVASSWWNDFRNTDMSPFQGVKPFLIVRNLGLPGVFEKDVKAADYLHQELQQGMFIVAETEGFTNAMTWDEFRTYCVNSGRLELQSDKSDPLSQAEGARVEQNNELRGEVVVITGFLSLGMLGGVFGGPKTFKSFFTGDLLHQISVGGVFLGLKLEKMRVLLFDTEMDERDFKKRKMASKQHDGFHILLAKKMTLPEEVRMGESMDALKYYLETVKGYARKHDIQVVAIDCLYRLMNENNHKETQVVVDVLEELKSEGMLVIPVHHTRKNDPGDVDPFDNIAGYPNLQRAIEAGIMLSRVEDEGMEGVVKASFLVRSDPPIGDVLFQVRDFQIQVYDDEDDKPRYRSQADRLIDYIKANLPETKEDAIETEQLIAMMDASDDVEFKGSTIGRYKLSEWVEEGLLSVRNGNPNRYYQGPAISQE